MKRIAVDGLFVILVSLHAIAQIESGTIIVLNSSQNEIAVAADSRSHNATTYVDNRCKISALGNELIFAASGKTGYGQLNGTRLVWDAHAIAHEKFRQLDRKHTKTLPLKLATSWGNEVKKKLQTDLINDRAETISGANGDRLTAAIFAAFNSNGISIITGQVTYRFRDNGKPVTAFTITNKIERPIAVFIGDAEIADEFNANATSRAAQWRDEANIEATKAQDSVAFLAIKIVGLSIEFQPVKIINGNMMHTIGGPIDALRLIHGQGIEWIQRKANCPEN